MFTVTCLVLAGLGCTYFLAALLLGHGFDSSDAGGDAHAADTHGHGHGALHTVAGAARGAVSTDTRRQARFRFPLLSPLTLATLAATLGGLGLVVRHGLGFGETTSLVAALAGSVALTYVLTLVTWRLARTSRGTTVLYEDDFAGAPGEVLAPIPAGGLGEVAAVVFGQRYTGPAREVSGAALPRGERVIVLRREGATLVVSADRAGG